MGWQSQFLVPYHPGLFTLIVDELTRGQFMDCGWPGYTITRQEDGQYCRDAEREIDEPAVCYEGGFSHFEFELRERNAGAVSLRAGLALHPREGIIEYTDGSRGDCNTVHQSKVSAYFLRLLQRLHWSPHCGGRAPYANSFYNIKPWRLYKSHSEPGRMTRDEALAELPAALWTPAEAQRMHALHGGAPSPRDAPRALTPEDAIFRGDSAALEVALAAASLAGLSAQPTPQWDIEALLDAAVHRRSASCVPALMLRLAPLANGSTTPPFASHCAGPDVYSFARLGGYDEVATGHEVTRRRRAGILKTAIFNGDVACVCALLTSPSPSPFVPDGNDVHDAAQRGRKDLFDAVIRAYGRSAHSLGAHQALMTQAAPTFVPPYSVSQERRVQRLLLPQADEAGSAAGTSSVASDPAPPIDLSLPESSTFDAEQGERDAASRLGGIAVGRVRIGEGWRICGFLLQKAKSLF